VGYAQGHQRGEAAVTARPAVDVELVSKLADDLGRLRRMGQEGHVIDRLCWTVESLDALLRPTAGLLYRLGTPANVALGVVDRERAVLRDKLGVDK